MTANDQYGILSTSSGTRSSDFTIYVLFNIVYYTYIVDINTYCKR